MNLENVRRDDWILAGLALLLLLDLLILPWFSLPGVTIHAIGGTGSISSGGGSLTATDAPDGWLGILAVLCAVAVIADLAIERLSPETQMPAIGGGRASTRLVLVGATALFVALKFLFHIHFSLFGFGFWAAVVLTAALVFFALESSRGEMATAAGPGAVPAGGAAGTAVPTGATRAAPRAGTTPAGTPGAGTPGAGTPGAGTPGAGTPGAGTPPAGPAPSGSPGAADEPGSVGPPGATGPPPA